MEIHIARDRLPYDGSQLSSHFALRSFHVRGDSLVAFQGPMKVAEGHVADLEDLLDGRPIQSDGVLHFILEFFGADLETVILKQRLLARLAAEILFRETGTAIRVDGDDLYVEDKKLSVSIAAPSPVSCLIHFGLNSTTRGVPVKAASLADLGMDPDRMAEKLSKAFVEEMESVAWARTKVRGVP